MSNPNRFSSRGVSRSDSWQSSHSAAEESSSSFSSTSSSSENSSVHNADAEKVLQLTWIDALGTILSDVVPESEPVCMCKDRPILSIEYSANFAEVLGSYRALRSCMVALVRSPKTALQSMCHGANAGSGVLARWLLLTAFTIRQCSSHYTAWSDRRELVLNPHAFWASTKQRLTLPPFALPEGRAVSEEASKSLKDAFDRVAFHFQEVTQTWLPSEDSLPSDANGVISGEAPDLTESEEARLTVKALWHGIVWEMATISPIGRMYHKNFQVWHHRKEMLLYALEKMVDVRLLKQGLSAALRDKTVREATMAEMLRDEAAFNDELQNQYGVSFKQIDERVITADVIEVIDSKNYHVWTHRGGFVHAFAFLVNGPSKAKWRSDWLDFCGNQEVNCESAFFVDKEWIDQNSCIGSAPVPASAPIAREFSFTAKTINVDCFNNSAWCHRMFLLDKDVIAALLRRYAAGFSAASDAVPAAAEEQLTLPELIRLLKFICKKEVDFAMQWAFYRPSNECAYVYARGVAELYQSAVLRLQLHAAMCTQESHSGGGAASSCNRDSISHLLVQELRSPVPAACTGFANNAERHDDDGVTQCFLNASRYISWSCYLDTFSLLRYQQDVMHTVIVPRVDHYAEEINNSLRQLATMADSISDPDELENLRRRKLDGLYRNSTQFLLDNLYQVRAAMFLSCVTFLEQTWLLYWRDDKRQEVATARTPEDYACAGITDDILPREAWSRNVASARSLSEVNMFLEKEAMALSLAKKLVVEDPVRTKYWRHEVRRVMQREY